MNTQIIVECRCIGFSYNKEEVLDIEKLTIESPGVYALLGSNGSGKSTLLKIFAGLLNVSRGTITTGPLETGGSTVDQLLKQSVYIHQNPYMLSGSVFSNVAYGLRIKNIPVKEIEERVNKILSDLGLLDLSETRAKELSSGEMQRVALARGAVLNPRLLLLDEPTSNVDSTSTGYIETLIRTTADRGTAVIFSSHNDFFTKRIADTILFLERGHLKPYPGSS
jgi:tungstate transport system ATP-binding protein